MSLLAFSEQVINGLIISIFYALAALGVSLIFGVLKIVNFAHGQLYMLGGFAYYTLASLLVSRLLSPSSLRAQCCLLSGW